MSYFDNLQVIARGGGSPQARACRSDGDCPICGRTSDDGDKCGDCQRDADEAMGVES